MLKKIYSTLLFVALLPFAMYAQSGTWEWVSGPNTTNVAPVYGTKGVASTSNNPPGFYEAANWTDLEGNFWVYGGLDGNRDEHGDLWKYNPTAKTWTWVNGPGAVGYGPVYGTQGIPSSTTYPGCRAWGIITWTDANDNLWLYGGYGSNTSYGDLWEYSIETNQWTWMSGSNVGNISPVYGTQGVAATTNMPGTRNECSSGWVDGSDNLWLFGGEDANGDEYNDIWKYDITTNKWAWMNGTNGVGATGSYGTMGVTSSTNQPPARQSYSHWKDFAGNFYIFGGGQDEGSSALSDVWKYNPVTNMWTWVAGENTVNSTGSYGQYCVNNGSTGPMGRYENHTAQMAGCSSDAFVSFGGFTNVTGVLNDLWVFNSQTYEWTWVSGTDVTDGAGNYGTMGVGSTANLPPGRAGHCMWVDNAGNLWVFSGWGTSNSFYSDMWKYTPDRSCVATALSGGINTSLQQSIICPGDSTILTTTGATDVIVTPAQLVHVIDSTHFRLITDSTTTYTIAGNSACGNNDTVYVTLLVARPGQLNYSVSDTMLCVGTPVTVSAVYQANLSITPLTGVTVIDSSNFELNPAATTTYTLHGVSAVCGGADSAKFTVHVVQHNPITVSAPDSVICSGNFANITITGVSNLSVSSNIYGYNTIDSPYVSIYSYETGIYTAVINGTNSCGGNFADSITLTWLDPGVISYTLSKSLFCVGDSSLLTLSGSHNTTIIPSGSVTWVDSTHAWLHPDTTTVYRVYSHGVCAGLDSTTFYVQVLTPGVVSYTLSDNLVCSGGQYVYIYVYGLINPVITPAGYGPYMIDSTESYFEEYVTGTTTYTVSGQSICGGNDVASITIKAIPYAGYYFSKNEICKGDSTLLTITGLTDITISPSTGVMWLDSASDSSHVYLSPDTTLTYLISGYNCSGYYYSYYAIVRVVSPGVLNYSISPTSLCAGSDAYLYLYGVTSGQILPTSYLYWNTTTDAYSYLYVDTTTRFTVIAQDVCGYTDTAHFTVTAVPEPSYVLQPSTICKGDSTKLTIAGISNAAISPTTGVVWIDSAHAWLSPDTTMEYILSGTTCDGYYADYYVAVNVVSPGHINYTLNTSSICAGNEAYLNINGLENVVLTPAAYLYMTDSSQWYAYLYPDTSTTYYLTGTSVCGGKDTAAIPIYVIPQTGYSLSSSVLCNGDSAILTLTGLSNIVITPNNHLTWIDSTHALLRPDSSGYFYITGYSLCDGYYYDNSFYLEVGTSGHLSYSVSDTTVCPGNVITLSVTSDEYPTITPYSYFYDDGTYYYTYLYPTADTTYVISDYGICDNKYDTAYFHASVINDPYFVMPNPAICSGDSTKINLFELLSGTAQITPAGGVNWIDSTSAWLSPDSTTVYTITGISVCGGNYNQPFTVNVHSPSVAVSASATQICQGDSSDICASAGFARYSWSDGQTTSCIEAKATGNYYVTVTDASGCTAVSTPVHLDVIPVQGVTIIQHGDTLISSITGEQQWYLNGFIIPGANAAEYIATSPGSYTVTVQGKDCGLATSPPVVIVSVGFGVINQDNISVYPNPSNASWYLTVSSDFVGSRVEVFDAEGKLVYQTVITNQTTEISAFASGVYLLRVISEDKVAVRKVVKL